MTTCSATADLAKYGLVILQVSCILDWPHEGDHVARLTWPVDPDDRILADLDADLDG